MFYVNFVRILTVGFPSIRHYTLYMNTIKSIYSHKWFRRLAPTIILVAWFAISGIGGPTFAKIADVSTNDQASFLPASAESTKAAKLQQQFYKSDTIPAIVVITSQKHLAPSDFTGIAALSNKLGRVAGVSNSPSAIAGPIPSKDGKAVEFIVQIKKDAALDTVVSDLRSTLKKNTSSQLSTYVTGPAGLSADLVAAFGGIDGILLVVALVAVFVILLLVYRSILLPAVVLLTAVFALSGAILFIYQLALHHVITLNGQSQGILSILVIGAATDYSLLFIARFKEALHHAESKWVALAQAYKGAFEPIAASAATVIVALLCLLFSDLNSNRSLGPVAAIGIALAFVSALTFLPALLVLFGRGSFWPTRPRYTKSSKANGDVSKIWGKVGKLIQSYPRRIWVVCSVVLVVCALGVLQLRASGTTQSDTLLNQSNAVDGQVALEKHFAAGSGSPVTVIVRDKDAPKTIQLLTDFKGVSTVLAFTGGSPDSHMPPKDVDGQVLLNATLTNAADSSAAGDTVVGIRNVLRKNQVSGVVGGEPATMLDSNTTAKQDLHKIVPIVLVVILVILMLLLRSVVAAVILIATVVLSYLATLGVSALVFNHIFHFAGADPSVPLFGFIFLVALGVDYNIFLMTRVREESKRSDIRTAIIHALQVTGSVITSAGVVLAATFAALGIIPILFLAQLAFIVSFGVLLDTIVVRSLLLASLNYDIGSTVWWPSARAKRP